MIWRYTLWICLSLLLIALAAALYLHMTARAALDKGYHYSAQVAELPRFKDKNGLTQLDFRGFTYRVRLAGFEENPDSPAVILLHGFPVTSAMWLPITETLVQAGYRVVAPDQRGYSPGARPEPLQAYRMGELVADVIALADTLGLENFHLVGHDWGAAVGWHVALAKPGRLLSWSALSIPHPAAFADALENDPDQQRRSRYFSLLSLPWLPETVMSMNNFASLAALGSPDWPQQAREYVAMFSEPGAATAALNWYRAMPINSPRDLASDRQLQVPTLFIWGGSDPVVGRYSVEAQLDHVSGEFEELELDAGHRVVTQQPGAVSNALLAHFERNP